jgi:hypothetical protein
MYKSTQDQGDYFNRVASHATKPSRRGIIRDIPAWAKEPEEYYNSLLEQHDTLMTRLHDTRERVIWLRKQLKATLPFETYERLQHELDFATPLLVDLEQQSGLSRAAVRSAANNAWGRCFIFWRPSSYRAKFFARSTRRRKNSCSASIRNSPRARRKGARNTGGPGTVPAT